ncbi:hypothetical protein BGZ65_001298 [Modicella reniformis]|uniref:AIG1-type G domain-containing protein n=1 Tax=Modicella reniformis TaxID=1440133 RepID=A0A9P6MJV7_9FUNG|nr:hypothetical protein BGZ65_001298 [Modicella reniformis]
MGTESLNECSHVEQGLGPVVLIAIGKTGQGKSSLLNKIMGTNELKASASVRAVTKGIAERSGWARFEDNRRFLVTLADTPGLADTEGDDEKNIPILKEYILSVGTRLGVTAFLLIFKIDSSVDIIMTILKTFNELTQDLPNVWDNVVLVFTGCDYRRDILDTKQLLHRELRKQIYEHFLKDRPSTSSASSSTTTTTTSTSTSSRARANTADPLSCQKNKNPASSSPMARSASMSETPGAGIPMVFLTTVDNICLIALGGARCDCEDHAQYLKTGLKRLWYEARKMKRWVLHAEENEDEFKGHVEVQ